jgi:hypothetical protein
VITRRLSAIKRNWTSYVQPLTLLANAVYALGICYSKPPHWSTYQSFSPEILIDGIHYNIWNRYSEQVIVRDKRLRMYEASHQCGQVWKGVVHRNKSARLWLITALTQLPQDSFVYFIFRSFLHGACGSMDAGMNSLSRGRKSTSMSYCLHLVLQFNSCTVHFGQ